MKAKKIARKKIARMDDLIREEGFVPFQRKPWINPYTGRRDSRVLGERPPYRFVVARDEWERTFAPLLIEPNLRLEYAGWPVEPDDTLAPGSIIFVDDSVWNSVSQEGR